MPTYEYECSNGHNFEITQRITEPALERCTMCKAKARRLISAPRFILKGGGWYADGYSSKGSAGSDRSSSDSSSASSSSSESKTAPAKSSSSDSPSSSSSDS